jgi:hypothetical protein
MILISKGFGISFDIPLCLASPFLVFESRLFLEIEAMFAGGRDPSQQREGLALQIIEQRAPTIISIRKSQHVWFLELTDKIFCLRLIRSTEIARI